MLGGELASVVPDILLHLLPFPQALARVDDLIEITVPVVDETMPE